jgi:hypothetical protein
LLVFDAPSSFLSSSFSSVHTSPHSERARKDAPNFFKIYDYLSSNFPLFKSSSSDSFIHSPYTKQWVLIRSPIPLTISTNRSLSSCSASLYLNNRFLSFSLISYDLLHSSTITRFQLPLISSRFYFFSLYCIQFECAM